MVHRYLAIGLGCGLALAACSREGAAPQALNGQSKGTSLSPTVPAECRGYEMNVYPNGRAPSAMKEVEIIPQTQKGAEEAGK